LNRVSYRVSSARDEFVIILPVSPYFGQPQDAFNYYILKDATPEEVAYHETPLQYHPKAAARRLHLATLRAKSPSVNTVMEFRIPLKKKFRLELANVTNNDPYFHDGKFVHYPDGSMMLHAELVADSAMDGCNAPLDRNSASMINLCSPPPADKILGSSVSVPSLGAGIDDECSLMDVTVASKATVRTPRTATTTALVAGGYLSVLASPPAAAAAVTTMTTLTAGGTPVITQHGGLTLFADCTDNQSTAGFSGAGVSHQDARSVKSRVTVATTGGGSKRKLLPRGRRSLSSNTTMETRATTATEIDTTNRKQD
jgi:hypothetical protein